MILAGLFAGVLFLGLIVGDWLYFVRLTPDAIRYGCTIARSEEQFMPATVASLRDRFPGDRVLMLPHGLARWYPTLGQIAIRPQYRLFSMSFRTAWPIKGLIYFSAEEQTVRALCVKFIPWSSAIITLAWFLLVSLGSTAFLVAYIADGGYSSLSGLLMGAGITGIGLLVLAFGLVTVVLSYRLENHRLALVYDELRDVLEGRLRSHLLAEKQG